MERKLLHTPEGVRDIYNGECTQKLYIQDKIHNILKLYGYTDIQTPSFEFLIYLIRNEARSHHRICSSYLTGREIPWY